MVPAGRMTATAHADIGARFRARPKAWVWGYVQTCDDVRRFRRRSRLGVCSSPAPRASNWRERSPGLKHTLPVTGGVHLMHRGHIRSYPTRNPLFVMTARKQQAARFECAVAGLSVTRPGTAPSMPSRVEVDRLYHNGEAANSRFWAFPRGPGRSRAEATAKQGDDDLCRITVAAVRLAARNRTLSGSLPDLAG